MPPTQPPERKEKDAVESNLDVNESHVKKEHKFKMLTARLLRVSRAELVDQERILREAKEGT